MSPVLRGAKGLAAPRGAPRAELAGGLAELGLERRRLDDVAAEAVEEVLAEAAGVDLDGEVAVSGGDEKCLRSVAGE